MNIKARAAVLNEISGKLTIQDIDVSEPNADEVVVEITACGICHTDLAIRDGALPVPLPVVLGHEGAGHVIAVGSAVSGVAIGDPVMLSYGSCGNCSACVSQQTPYCQDFVIKNFSASRADNTTAFSAAGKKIHSHFFGQSAFSTHAVVPIRNVVKAPTDIPLEILAPLGCGIQTGAGSVLNELNVRAGSTILVMGAGAVGTAAIMASRIAGAARIIALDIAQSRLELAQELGATDALMSDGRPISELLASINIEGVDYILDTTGVPSLVNDAVGSLNIRGVFGLAAAYPHHQMMEIDFATMMLKGQRIQGIVEGGAVPQDFLPKLIAYYRQGLFPFDRLIKQFDFEQINEAIAACESGETIKPVLCMH